MSDLTAELGVNKPSLYAAFGNKEALFQAAIDHYLEQYGKPRWQHLTEPSDTPLKNRLKAYFYDVIALVTDREHPSGCLLVKSTCECRGEAVPETLTESMQHITEQNLAAWQGLLEREQSAGNLSDNLDPSQLAGYFVTVLYGLATLANSGQSAESLRSVADLFISTALHK